jgi:hypothetical protein
MGTLRLAVPAPAGGTIVTLGSNLPGAASVPPSVTVPAGATTASFTVTTFLVAATTAQLTARLGDTILFASLTLTPAAAAAPAAPSLLSPASGAAVTQPVTLDWGDVAGATAYEVQVDDSSTIAAPFIANQIVAGSQITLSGLAATRHWWRVRARNAAGVFGAFSSTRRFTPQAAAATPSPPPAPTPASLSSLAINPLSVVGPASATGTATLSAAAPAGGALVSLSSNHPAASVPASVTVAAGATSGTFTVATSSATTSSAATLTAAYGGVSRTATLTVNPVPVPGAAAALTVTATGRSGERIVSNPAGLSVLVGATGAANFSMGSSVTLSVSGGRDAVWSGGCSSGGSKTKSCTFTITGNASITGDVR